MFSIRQTIYLTVLFLYATIGCKNENWNPDYRIVITHLQRNDFYKQLIGHYIVQRRRENQYFYMSDSLVSPIFRENCGKAVLRSDEKEELETSLHKKAVTNTSAYIQDIETKASVVIPFMRENGVYVVRSNLDSSLDKNIFLHVYLENDYCLYLIEKNFDGEKAFREKSQIYITRINNWLVMLDTLARNTKSLH